MECPIYPQNDPLAEWPPWNMPEPEGEQHDKPADDHDHLWVDLGGEG